MTTIGFLFTILLTGVGTSFADITDSGNLTIGGQGVIGGTMTVSGNAFSVGGSTFSVSAGSVGVATPSPATTFDVNGSAQFGGGANKSTFTAAGLLKLTSSGIQWADGSTSTTAASGGSGNAVLSATQTWSGANTFLSSTTFGFSGAYTNAIATANYAAIIKGGPEVEVAMASFTAASSVQFYNLLSSATYRLELSFVQNSNSADFLLQFNDDAGNNYSYAGNCNNTNVAHQPGVATTSSIKFDDTANSPLAGDVFYGDIIIRTFETLTKKVFARYDDMTNSSNVTRCEGAGAYSGSAVLTSIKLSPSAGTWTGKARLFYRQINQAE